MIGLGAPSNYMDIVDDWFEGALRKEDPNLGLALGALEAKTQKWGGSHEQMFALADNLSTLSSFYNSVKAMAYIEHWLYLDCWGQNKEEAQGYFDQQKLIREISRMFKNDSCLSSNCYFSLMALNIYCF